MSASLATCPTVLKCLITPLCAKQNHWNARELGIEREACIYRLGGNSCLSGDYMGYWQFKKPLQIGDIITFEDMIHYTTVKTNMFNGIHHPSIRFERLDGSVETLRDYTYEDYRDRMD